VPIIELNYQLKSYGYSGENLKFGGNLRIVGSYVCLLFVNINQRTYKQDLRKPFLSKQKPVDRDGFCENQDAFCDAGSEIGLRWAEIVRTSRGFWVPAEREGVVFVREKGPTSGVVFVLTAAPWLIECRH
jgi:hypothetical protein